MSDLLRSLCLHPEERIGLETELFPHETLSLPEELLLVHGQVHSLGSAPTAAPFVVLRSMPLRCESENSNAKIRLITKRRFAMKRILVAVDGSKYGLEAVKAAAKLAVAFNLKSVTLINVIPVVISPVGPSPVAAPPEDIEAWEVFAEPKAILKEAGVEAKLLLREGDPAYEIVQAAKAGGYDLIIVGHRGLSPIETFLLGSVSNRVAAHAHCSVLVVRPGLENNGE
jgi:nucleotide-binding universal stress UspA family protein